MWSIYLQNEVLWKRIKTQARRLSRRDAIDAVDATPSITSQYDASTRRHRRDAIAGRGTPDASTRTFPTLPPTASGSVYRLGHDASR